LNLREEEAAERLRGVAAIKVVPLDGDDFFTTERKWNALKEALVSALRAFHTARPLEPGRDMEDLREKLRPAVTPKMFRAFVESLEMEGAIARTGSLLRLPEHRVSLRDEDRQTAGHITRLLGVNPLAPPDLTQVAREAGIDRARLTDVLRVLERERAVVRVAPDMYYLSNSLEDVKRIVWEDLADRADITPAMFRDRLGITRKHAIPLLEYLDREGVTVRLGNTRRVRTSRSTVS
jgi:selenocysteine-specific elongation factor